MIDLFHPMPSVEDASVSRWARPELQLWPLGKTISGCNGACPWKWSTEGRWSRQMLPNVGWGALCNGKPAFSFWLKEEGRLHINGLEMLAVYLGLCTFLPNLRGHHVLVCLDTMTVVSFINHQGGLSSKRLFILAECILEWAQLNLLLLRATHVLGRLNQGADMLSRSNVPSDKWTLHQQGGSRRLNPPCPITVPTWDLSTVLRALKRPPFELLQSIDLLSQTLKSTLLLALASVKHMGDLQALSVSPSCLEFGPSDFKVTLKHGIVTYPKCPWLRLECRW